MNKDKENKDQQHDFTNTNKGDKKDTSNSLEQNAQGDKGANTYTPQNRTDNEQTDKK